MLHYIQRLIHFNISEFKDFKVSFKSASQAKESQCTPLSAINSTSALKFIQSKKGNKTSLDPAAVARKDLEGNFQSNCLISECFAQHSANHPRNKWNLKCTAYMIFYVTCVVIVDKRVLKYLFQDYCVNHYSMRIIE